MENPATWNETVKLINEAITDHQDGMESGLCGLSLGRMIHDRLEEAGKLSPEVFTSPEPDGLEDIFRRQECTMQELRLLDKLPEWPIDITTKPAQRLLKEHIFNACEELFEASYTLKNKSHRQTDVRVIDREHFVEEIGDALAFILEVCILSGVTPEELYGEFCRKNAIVVKRIQEGY